MEINCVECGGICSLNNPKNIKIFGAYILTCSKCQGVTIISEYKFKEELKESEKEIFV